MYVCLYANWNRKQILTPILGLLIFVQNAKKTKKEYHEQMKSRNKSFKPLASAQGQCYGFKRWQQPSSKEKIKRKNLHFLSKPKNVFFSCSLQANFIHVTAILAAVADPHHFAQRWFVFGSFFTCGLMPFSEYLLTMSLRRIAN